MQVLYARDYLSHKFKEIFYNTNTLHIKKPDVEIRFFYKFQAQFLTIYSILV